MRPNDSLKVLQEKFVRLRIVNMADVDVALFDFDFDLTFSLFVLNHERNVYLRYGARDDQSSDSYLTEKSVVRALESGLALHERWQQGMEMPPPPEPKPVQAYKRLEAIVKKGECIHCHQVADAQVRELVALPDFDKKADSWPYPDPRKLGLIIDPDLGNVLASAVGPAMHAGMKKGTTITDVAGRTVSTFADLQYALHHVEKGAKAIDVKTLDNTLKLKLPEYWRVTDINRRSMGHRLTPFPGFWGATLSSSDKQRLNLEEGGFASEVTKFWVKTNGKRAGLEVGDIVFAVNGVKTSPLAKNAMIYISTHFEAGDEIKIEYLRGGEKGSVSYKLRAKPW